MEVNGVPYRTIRPKPDNPEVIEIIDQRQLPYRLVHEEICDVAGMAAAIREMHVRGAPLIGAAGAYGMYLAMLGIESEVTVGAVIRKAYHDLAETRPTAVNLIWALNRSIAALDHAVTIADKRRVALDVANRIADDDIDVCRRIGQHGLTIIEQAAADHPGRPIHILTHCNAGWLACIDHGTATAPIYAAHARGLPIHVWVDETRPRNQGARLTAWELANAGVPHTVVADNTGGYLMQKAMVDLVLVGTDRTTRTGDVVNKIGTYLKALAARDNAIPFYVAAPTSSIDWNVADGLDGVPIEERDADEIRFVTGIHDDASCRVRIIPADTPAVNYAFDVTPARLVTALITEFGVCAAGERSMSALFREHGFVPDAAASRTIV